MNKLKNLNIIVLPALIAISSSCSAHRQPPSDDILYSDNYSGSTMSAQTTAPQSGKVLTVEEAIKIGLANNPNIQIGQLKAVMAQAQYYGTILAITPSVTATSGTYNASNYTNQQSTTAISGNINIWNGMQSQMNILSAQAQTASAEEMSLNIQRLLAKQIALAYNQVLIDKANIKIQRDNLTFYQQQLQKIQSKPDSSKKALSDILQFKTNIDIAQAAIIRNIENFNNDKCALAVLMGLPSAKLPSNTIFPEIEIPKEAQTASSVDYYLDLAISQRPDLKASKEDLKSANYNLYGSYGQLSPVVNAGAVAAGNQNAAIDATGINANQNLNPTSAITNIRTAETQKDSANEELLSQWMQVLGDVRTSYNQLSASYANEKIIRDQCAYGQQARDIVTEEYNDGKVGITRLTEAQNNLVQAELQLIQTMAEINKSKADLDAAVGIGMK